MTPNIDQSFRLKNFNKEKWVINFENSAIHAIFAYYVQKSALMKPYMSSSSGWNLKIFQKKICWNLFFHNFFIASLIKVLFQTSSKTMKRLYGRVQNLKFPPLFFQIFLYIKHGAQKEQKQKETVKHKTTVRQLTPAAHPSQTASILLCDFDDS